jgi:predicted amidohydrolase
MGQPFIDRRDFAKGLLLNGAATVLPLRVAAQSAQQLRAAAIQMTARLGDVPTNLAQAEHLARAALSKGAQLIIFPEMFSSAMGFHDDVLRAIRPIDGAPTQLMQKLARDGNALIGGSFLARDGDDVFNTFLLVSPDGSFSRHDKDHPTLWENCYYRPGKDDGVLTTAHGSIGVALCWEFIRSKTVKRLRGKVKLVVGGSCWWTLPDDVPSDHPNRAVNLKMLQDAPPRLARMLGVPVVHGSHAGKFAAFRGPELPDVEYNSSLLGETMIVDAGGDVLARRGRDEGAGFVIANLTIPNMPEPVEKLPDRFWLPPELPAEWKASWQRWFAKGDDYYNFVTRPYIQTGKIKDYEPPFFRN